MLVLPTKEDFRNYSGENIAGKLSGDIKEQERLLEILFRRCEDIIIENLVGIKVDDLTDAELLIWHKLIMEQAEYLLSVGDRALIDDEPNMSSRIERIAIRSGLWNARVCWY
jgi:hypothetical protein